MLKRDVEQNQRIAWALKVVMFPWQKSSKAGVRRQSWLSQGASSPVQHASSVAGSVSGLRYSQGFLPHSDSLRDRLEPVQR